VAAAAASAAVVVRLCRFRLPSSSSHPAAARATIARGSASRRGKDLRRSQRGVGSGGRGEAQEGSGWRNKRAQTKAQINLTVSATGSSLFAALRCSAPLQAPLNRAKASARRRHRRSAQEGTDGSSSSTGNRSNLRERS
jgi:hypothetical protein